MLNRMLHFLAVLLLFSCQEESDTLRIAVAANMQSAAEELLNSFEQESGIQCELILGSSGKLTNQIINGAPFDVFLSADLTYPEKLLENNKAEGDISIYAQGELVLWSSKNGLTKEDLMDADKIAIPNPEIAPYGKAALAYLQSEGLYEQLKSRFVFGESVGQTNQFIQSGSVSLGFTSLSSVLNNDQISKDSWILLEADKYPPINQGMVIIKKDGKTDYSSAQKFKDFVISETGIRILKNSGYQVRH